jgi:hypothetical protein
MSFFLARELLPKGDVCEGDVMTDLLIPITDVEALKAAGILHPGSENAWRWCFRYRHVRGLEYAFKRNGRRIVVDVDAFKAAIRKNDASGY